MSVDLTRYAGIGEGIASAIREIVLSGTLGRLEQLRAQASPALASISEYPRLDPKRVARSASTCRRIMPGGRRRAG